MRAFVAELGLTLCRMAVLAGLVMGVYIVARLTGWGAF